MAEHRIVEATKVAAHKPHGRKHRGRQELVEGNPSVARDLKRLEAMLMRGNSTDAAQLLWKLLGSGDRETAEAVERISKKVSKALIARGERKKANYTEELAATIAVAAANINSVPPRSYAREMEEYLAGKNNLIEAMRQAVRAPPKGDCNPDYFSSSTPWLVPKPKPIRK